MIESFVGYSSLGFCSLRVCMMSVQDLLAFIASVEESGVILIDLPSYVTCSSFLQLLGFFLCFAHSVF